MVGMRRLIFISYRRQRGYELAHLVNAELRARGLRTFIDVADSEPGQFWAQAQAAIRSCRALVLICTNGSFEIKQGDDWVLREVSEAMALGRPIVPIFSQDFEPPSALPPPLAQAIEYSGVSMDTQFHVAAFDHLSQLVGGRKRSEQRRRVAILGSLAFLTVLASLVLGAREIVGLTEEFRREREARQALERSRADERRAAEQRQLEADARSDKLARELAALEKRRSDQIRADEDREQRARDEMARREEVAKYAAERQAEQRRRDCSSGCQDTRRHCESSCFSRFDGQLRASCNDSCKQYEPFCVASCR